MNEILCHECGKPINEHHSPIQHKGVTCPLAPQDIAAHAVAEARKDAFFLADVWTTIRAVGLEFIFTHGDPDGIDFVASKVIYERINPAAPESQS